MICEKDGNDVKRSMCISSGWKQLSCNNVRGDNEQSRESDRKPKYCALSLPPFLIRDGSCILYEVRYITLLVEKFGSVLLDSVSHCAE